MRVHETELPGVLLIEPDVFTDHRGFLLESFNEARFARHGLALNFVQVNHSRSHRGVLRGLHFQVTAPYGKLVFAVRGEVFDVAVDVRRGSPTFGRWTSTRLSDANHHAMWIPGGFAHGFCALSEHADLVYKCTGRYDGGDDHVVAWNDPDIGIAWPDGQFELSDKDRDAPPLSELRALPDYAP